ncbi:MAG: DUF368 domain-containing protein [Planctomycetota bacterium]
MEPNPEKAGGRREDVFNFVRGFCMGAADTVPGVSGGTVALILGHYQRLVSAISHVDSELFTLLKHRQITSAAKHVDARFMLALLGGVFVGVITLSGLMHWLLENRMSETLAVFLGLMIASIFIVASKIERWSKRTVSSFVVGLVVAFGIALIPIRHAELHLPYLFVASSLAICAMILPGISGAFVLLIFGVYHGITGLIKEFAKLNITFDGFIKLMTFGLGCLTGLLLFSKLLRHLLREHHDLTMACLVGLMTGSLVKLWPLQRATAETADEDFKERTFELVSPSQWDGSVLPMFFLSIAAVGVVVIAERMGSRLAMTEKHHDGV